MANALVRADHNYTVNKNRVLTPDQNDAVEFLLTHFFSINGAQAGLGKTTIMLSTLHHIFNYSDKVMAVIICPKAATTAFMKDSEALGMPLSVYTTDYQIKAKGSRMFLFNYSKLDLLGGLLEMAKSRGLKVIAVLDEVHSLANDKSAVYQKMMAFRPYFCCIYGMTATLFINDLMGLYNVINYIRPNFLGDRNSFRNKYLIIQKRQIARKGRRREVQEVVGYKDLDELKGIVEQMTIIRGHKYNLQYHSVTCKMTKEEWDAYATAAEGIFADGYDVDNPKDWGARLHDLQRIVDVSNSKIYSLVKLCKSIIEKGESVLVYTDYEETYEFLRDNLEKYKDLIGYNKLYLITGKTSNKDRRVPEKEMQPGDITIITRAGSTSVNLQKANHIIYYNLPFSIGIVIQSFGRICRMDTKFPVQHLYLVEAQETIDTYKKMMFEEHKYLMEAIYGDTHNLPCMTLENPAEISKQRAKFRRRFLWVHFRRKGN